MSLMGEEGKIPAGLNMRLSMDDKAMNNFVQLSEEDKNKLVDYVSLSTTQEEMGKRVVEIISQLGDETFY